MRAIKRAMRCERVGGRASMREGGGREGGEGWRSAVGSDGRVQAKADKLASRWSGTKGGRTGKLLSEIEETGRHVDDDDEERG